MADGKLQGKQINASSLIYVLTVINWSDHIESIAWSKGRNVGSLFCAIFAWKPILNIYKSTIQLCIENYCHTCSGAPNIYVEFLYKIQRRVYNVLDADILTSFTFSPTLLSFPLQIFSWELSLGFLLWCINWMNLSVLIDWQLILAFLHLNYLWIDWNCLLLSNNFITCTSRLWTCHRNSYFPVTYNLINFKFNVNPFVSLFSLLFLMSLSSHLLTSLH